MLAVRRRLLGYEHPNRLTSMNDLAITLWQSGAAADAIAMTRAAADGRAKILGPQGLAGKE